MTRALSLLGLVFLIIGVATAARPIKVLGTDCGSVIKPAGGITPMACDSRLGDRGVLALALGAGGLAVAVTGLGVASVSARRKKP
jgi:hypothetical protein